MWGGLSGLSTEISKRRSFGQGFLVQCLSEHFCRAGNISLFPLPPLLSPDSSFLQRAYDLALLCVYWLGFVGFGIENVVDFVSLGC